MAALSVQRSFTLWSTRARRGRTRAAVRRCRLTFVLLYSRDFKVYGNMIYRTEA